MTLVQVLADEHSFHLACDFRLTDARTGGFIQDTTFKIVTVGTLTPVTIGVTGLAHLGGKPVADWLADVADRVDGGPAFQDTLLTQLRETAQPLLASVPDTRIRRTTLVVGGHIGTQVRISLVSNFEVFLNGRVHRSPTGADDVAISSIKPKAPMYFTTGVAQAVPAEAQEEVRLLLRARSTSQAIQQRLADINAEVSNRHSAVSTGCYVVSRLATGHGSSRPFLTDAQADRDMIPPDFELMLRGRGLGRVSQTPAAVRDLLLG